MSGSKIRLYGSTSGYVELEAPAVAPDGVLTLPTGTGGFGKTLQVVQTVKTDAFTMASQTFTAVTGLAATITPTSVSSKVLVLVSIGFSGDGVNTSSHGRLMRGATPIFIGDAAGSRIRATSSQQEGNDSQPQQSWVYLDSPATTSSVTYSVEVARNAASGTVFVNRTPTDTDSATFSRQASSITLIEVAA